MLSRKLYLPPAGENEARWCTVSYIDDKLTRLEVHRTSGESDTYLNYAQRVSHDNGKTWTPLSPIEGVTRQLPEGGLVTYPGRYFYDPGLKILYQLRMRRFWPGNDVYTFNWGGEHAFVNQVFVLENSVEKQLRYEAGPEYEPENPFAHEFLERNRAYFGTNIAIARDGTAFLPMVCYKHGDEYSLNRGGVVLMRRDPETGQWLASNQQYIAPELSSRGLLEPAVAILSDGTLLIVCRGSNTSTKSGRKWFCTSTDSGMTLSPVQEFRYDDGTRFYSPSSIHHFIRSTKNGKLYWLANIVKQPPEGNSPRYPLYITEIDEEKIAVKKNNRTLVDDRREDDPDKLQLSNFCVLEDRETLDFEIYLTRIGQDAESFWRAGVYEYTFVPR
ncbi:exo-alpha-sialidase [candidate division KSB1 bacterium]|nr:exo-alpha-sialidase [candidate division KSB1 bacterium]